MTCASRAGANWQRGLDHGLARKMQPRESALGSLDPARPSAIASARLVQRCRVALRGRDDHDRDWCRRDRLGEFRLDIGRLAGERPVDDRIERQSDASATTASTSSSLISLWPCA